MRYGTRAQYSAHATPYLLRQRASSRAARSTSSAVRNAT
jgi:hypothetical protein